MRSMTSPRMWRGSGIFRRRSADSRPVIARERNRRSNPVLVSATLECLSEPVIGRRFAPTRWLAMTEKSLRRQNRALDRTEADAIAVALAPAAHHERIAVFQERAPGPALQLDRLGAIPADLQQAAALMFLRPGDGAGAQEIADIHRA